MNTETYYRYETWHMDFANSIVDIEPDTYVVLSTTPKGVWVIYPYCKAGKKFILNNAKKKFAYPTKDEALYAFYRRKLKQKRILECTLEICDYIINELEKHGVNK